MISVFTDHLIINLLVLFYLMFGKLKNIFKDDEPPKKEETKN